MKPTTAVLAEKLAGLRQQDKLRHLPTVGTGIDFWSNDYLGIARDFPAVSSSAGGATGSRLISGNAPEYLAIEADIATFHGAEAALVFNSGYTANLGLLSAVPQRGDVILYDQLIHASLRDGIRLGGLAKAYNFRHNDLDHLRERLQKASGRVFVVTEAIFSMDGDAAPLVEMATLCATYDAALIVDEAHSVGLYGQQGRGLVSELDLETLVFARIVTYGKAMGCHGAAILGSRTLIDFLINTSRPFIYSTGPSPHAWATIKQAYDTLQAEHGKRFGALQDNIKQFKQLQGVGVCNGSSADPETTAKESAYATWLHPIQLINCPGNERVLAVEAALRSQGVLVKAIRHPTVAVGQERIRICLHAFNTQDEISWLINLLQDAH
ncbi:MAG: 8-amino-7-oxononanoate synthase [Bacteroidota bacterium]